MNRHWIISLVVALVASLSGGCIPYTVASTARTTPVGDQHRSLVVYTVPSAIKAKEDSIDGFGMSIPGSDFETRWGIDERTDLGIRIPSYSGIVMSYKRQLTGVGTTEKRATAYMLGAGLVNWGQHAHIEGTYIVSGAERTATPYGGLRVMQVVPLSSAFASDRPTAGAFFGIRLGDGNVSIAPEIGVFYDHSALGHRSRDVIVVPSISVRNVKLGLPK